MAAAAAVVVSELHEQMVGGTGIDDYDDDAEPVNRARASRCCLHGLGRVRIPILLYYYVEYYIITDRGSKTCSKCVGQAAVVL